MATVWWCTSWAFRQSIRHSDATYDLTLTWVAVKLATGAYSSLSHAAWYIDVILTSRRFMLYCTFGWCALQCSFEGSTPSLHPLRWSLRNNATAFETNLQRRAQHTRPLWCFDFHSLTFYCMDLIMLASVAHCGEYKQTSQVPIKAMTLNDGCALNANTRLLCFVIVRPVK